MRLIYRPSALDYERKRFRYEADFLRSQRFVSEWIASHIVGTDSEMPVIEWVRSLEADEPTYRKLFLTVQGLLPDDSGEAWKDVEQALAENLRVGLELELTNPRLARRSCEECKRLWFSETTGLVILRNGGEPLERFGPTMCETAEGCAKGTPDNPKSLNKTNRWAWAHFRSCDAIGVFPDDSIVKRNAAIIRRVIKAVERRSVKK